MKAAGPPTLDVDDRHQRPKRGAMAVARRRAGLMARTALSLLEISAWLRRSADAMTDQAGRPGPPPMDWRDSYRSPVVGLLRNLARQFPGGQMTLDDWEEIDKRMREILAGERG
jgi:hypothetical protein